MRRFLNNRISNYNNVGDKVDDFCEDCENRWLPFSRVWWDSTEKNIADIKRKDNGIFVIKKILSLINSISESIKDIYDRINVIETPILSEKLLELENDYLEVGVTADDKQEGLNIAIYENYINLKNTKVDKPLIESTSDSLKIVALDNQGESVFIKSNELGKVKSVNNKIGDVILKTSDLENDSDYTTNLKLNQERDERISGDNLKLDKPTTSGTTTTHPNIVGVDDLGNSAKLKATDFGKVKSVNGKEGDVILKTSDLENNSDYTTNAILTAHTSNKSNPHNVTKEQIGLGNVDNTSDLNKPISTATQTELNKKLDKPTTTGSTISHPNVVGVDSQGNSAKLPASDLGKNFANTDLVVNTNRKHTGTASVEFGMPFICSNASVRYSGLLDKSADATYNQLLGVDSNGYTAKVGLNAVTNAMSKSTDAQKDAFRLASRKSTENYNTSAPIISIVNPFLIKNINNYPINLVITGNNLFIDKVSSSLQIRRIKDINDNPISDVWIDITSSINVSEINNSLLAIYHNFKSFPAGYYEMKLTNQIGLSNLTSPLFMIVDNYEDTPINAFEVISNSGNLLSQSTIGYNFTETTITSGLNGGMIFKGLVDIVDSNVNSITTIEISHKNPSTDYDMGEIVAGFTDQAIITPTTMPIVGVKAFYKDWHVRCSDVKNNKDLGISAFMQNNQINIFKIHLFIKDGTYSILSESHSKVSEGFYTDLSKLNFMLNITRSTSRNGTAPFTASITSFKKIN